MEKLHNKILSEGRALNESVLKVDSFLNHGVDAKLMYEIGTCFREYFNSKGITKIFTIESSGIAPAVMTALQMNLPMVTLKKQTSKILNGEVYQTTVHSFTKGSDYELTLSKKYISENVVLCACVSLRHTSAFCFACFGTSCPEVGKGGPGCRSPPPSVQIAIHPLTI